MHVTQILASQVLAEEETAGASWAAVVLLSFGLGVAEFLFAFASYEDGAAVFEVGFNLAEIYLFGFLNFDVFAGIVIKK